MSLTIGEYQQMVLDYLSNPVTMLTPKAFVDQLLMHLDQEGLPRRIEVIEAIAPIFETIGAGRDYYFTASKKFVCKEHYPALVQTLQQQFDVKDRQGFDWYLALLANAANIVNQIYMIVPNNQELIASLRVYKNNDQTCFVAGFCLPDWLIVYLSNTEGSTVETRTVLTTEIRTQGFPAATGKILVLPAAVYEYLPQGSNLSTGLSGKCTQQLQSVSQALLKDFVAIKNKVQTTAQDLVNHLENHRFCLQQYIKLIKAKQSHAETAAVGSAGSKKEKKKKRQIA